MPDETEIETPECGDCRTDTEDELTTDPISRDIVCYECLDDRLRERSQGDTREEHWGLR